MACNLKTAGPTCIVKGLKFGTRGVLPESMVMKEEYSVLLFDNLANIKKKYATLTFGRQDLVGLQFSKTSKSQISKFASLMGKNINFWREGCS